MKSWLTIFEANISSHKANATWCVTQICNSSLT